VEQGGNFDYRYWDPVAITPSEGISQMASNGWEWTSSVFAPFEGFRPRPSYPGYSANFFDGKHFVMKGASPRTAAKLVRPSLRNWFRAEYPYVYATFRLCLP
jgi:formylglycine-generating enzyme required for sulfatase activity